MRLSKSLGGGVTVEDVCQRQVGFGRIHLANRPESSERTELVAAAAVFKPFRYLAVTIRETCPSLIETIISSLFLSEDCSLNGLVSGSAKTAIKTCNYPANVSYGNVAWTIIVIGG